MSRVSSKAARRIDHLSRYAHRFHRYAHHPLCAEYRGELVQLGRRTRVCRGCSLALAGASGGTLVGLAAPTGAFHVSIAIWCLAVSCGVALTLVRSGGQRVRWPKAWSRFLPTALMLYAVTSSLRDGWLGVFLALTTVFAAVTVSALYRRRGPDRGPCTVCPERDRPVPCRGVMPIVRRERAFRRLAGQWIARGS